MSWKIGVGFPILLTLEHVEVGVIAMFLKCMIKYEFFLNQNLCLRWVCLGCDGDYIFQGCHNWATSQLSIVVPFFYWCALHGTSNQFASCCVVQTALGILHWVNVIVLLFIYIHSFNKFFEFINLIGILETKDLKLLRNVKTWWMFMLNPLKCVMAKYKGLIVKMHFNWNKTKFVHENLELPHDL